MGGEIICGNQIARAITKHNQSLNSIKWSLTPLVPNVVDAGYEKTGQWHALLQELMHVMNNNQLNDMVCMSSNPQCSQPIT
jgi:hypothetical protein